PRHPARVAERILLQLALHAVLVLEPVQHHVELQLANGTHYRRRTGCTLGVEHLRSALFSELAKARVQRLAAQRVLRRYAREVLGREARNAAELQRTTVLRAWRAVLHEGVADA